MSVPYVPDTPEHQAAKSLSNPELNEVVMDIYKKEKKGKYSEIFAEVLLRVAQCAQAKTQAEGITLFVIGFSFGRLIGLYRAVPYSAIFPHDFPEDATGQLIEGIKAGCEIA